MKNNESVWQRLKDSLMPKSEKERIAQLWPNVFLVSILALLLIAMLYMMTMPKVSGEFNCKVNNIELRDVRPYNCYGDFAAEYCPVPRDIECQFKGEVPARLLK